jgi:hypothetical protein
VSRDETTRAYALHSAQSPSIKVTSVRDASGGVAVPIGDVPESTESERWEASLAKKEEQF